jgi:hypothetical protein
MNILDFIGDKVEYDIDGQIIWSIKKDDMQMLLEVRGWGAIQNLFKNKDGTINLEKAEAFQDKMGNWIAEAVNEKILKEKKDRLRFKY